MRHDLLLAWRVISREPLVMAVATMGLALSIGISALAFTLLDTRFLSGGGIAESHAVSRVALLPSVFSRPTGDSPMQGNWTLVDFDRIRLGANTMALTASANVRRTLRTSDGSQTAVAGRAVTGNYFEALGAAATHGRLLAASDDRPGGAPVVVLSWALWRNLFGANARVVGQTVHLDDQAHVIVGVARRSFSGAGLAGLPPAAFWVPMSAAGDVWRAAEALRRTPSEPEVPWNPAVDVVGRLQEDATPSIAAAELHALAVALAPETLKAKTRIDLQPPNPRTPGEATSVAVAATLVVLLVVLAAANLAHLLVAGALAREPELALRRALGSSVWRLGRQLVAEALILGLTGAVIGSLLAAWATPVFAAAVGLPPTFDMSPSVGGAAFAAVIGVAAALFASLWPLHMLRQWSLRPTAFLDRRGHPGTRGRRSRAALLALQGATSLIAVAAAALLTRAAVQVATLDPGYQPDGLVEVRVGGYPRAYSAQQAWAFLSTALDRAGRRPDVAGGAAALVPPFSDVTMSQTTNGHRVSYNATTPAYFDVLGLRLVRGQVYGMASNEPVAMVSEGVARTFWGRTDPLGQTLEPVWGARNPFDPSTPPHTIRIIGVVSDAVTDLRSTNGLAVYRPLTPSSAMAARLIVRTREDGRSSPRPLIEEFAPPTDAPGLAITASRVSDGIARALETPRRAMWISVIVACAALGLALAGVFGTTVFSARQREHEIGVRVALGAGDGMISRQLAWDAVRPLLVGLILGLAATVFVGQLLRRMLYGLSAYDPLALVAAVVVLIVTVGAAAYLPARRASRRDAVCLLRER